MVSDPGQTPIWMRPESAGVGRPAQRSRAEITAAAIAIADSEGLDAVSMRRVAASLGTGAASLYRYVATRDDLLDLMVDATGQERELAAPTGDWLADLVQIGLRSREILRQHPWLVGLVITRPVLGPNGVTMLEQVLAILAGHPASLAAKMEAFAMLTGITAMFVQNELAGGSSAQRRNVAYLEHVIESGARPVLARLLGEAAAAGQDSAGQDSAGQDSAGQGPADSGPADSGPADPADRFEDVLARILTGLLGPAGTRPSPGG